MIKKKKLKHEIDKSNKMDHIYFTKCFQHHIKGVSIHENQLLYGVFSGKASRYIIC